MLQTFTISGAAVRQINAKATFFQYESGSASGADESIKVRADGNDLGVYLPGDSIELPEAATRWEITALSALNVGRVRLGVGRINSNRIVGAVKVIDNGAEKTQEGRQFHGSNTAPADAANFSMSGILANGARLAIKAIAVQSDVAGDVLIGRGTAPGTSTPAGASGLPNKEFGGAAAVHRLGVGIAAGVTPTAGEVPGYEIACRVFVPANTIVQIPLTTPLFLNGTKVMTIHGQAVNRKVGWVLDVEEL